MDISLPRIGSWAKHGNYYVYTLKKAKELWYLLFCGSIGVQSVTIDVSKCKDFFSRMKPIPRKEWRKLSKKFGIENFQYSEKIDKGSIVQYSIDEYGFVVDDNIIITIPTQFLMIANGCENSFRTINGLIAADHIIITGKLKEDIYNKICSSVKSPIRDDVYYYDLSHMMLKGDGRAIYKKCACEIMEYIIHCNTK